MTEDDGRRIDPEVDEKRRDIVAPLDFDTLRTEPALERMSRAASELLGVSMAHVSVMEDEQQCVIGKVGFDREHFARDQSFCAFALASRELEVVEDATQDERFASNPYVNEAPHIRFYAGVPLEVQDIPVGTFCAMHDEPMALDTAGRSTLRELARLVERFLATRVVAGSERDPRYRIAAQLTSMAALTAIFDSRVPTDLDLGEPIGELKECVDAGHDAIDDWIEEEHEDYFE